jgi:hypothetical protein
MDRIEIDASNNSSLPWESVYLAVAYQRKRDTHTDTQTDGRGFVKYAVEMGSGALIYVQSFIKIDCFSHSEVDQRDTKIYRQKGDFISLLSLFQNIGSRLENESGLIRSLCCLPHESDMYGYSLYRCQATIGRHVPTALNTRNNRKTLGGVVFYTARGSVCVSTYRWWESTW